IFAPLFITWFSIQLMRSSVVNSWNPSFKQNLYHRSARRPHRPQHPHPHPHLMFPIWKLWLFDIFVRPVDGGI
ncbi:hypothetical protein EDD22DRAFT_882356, partial [Suillus occidentalis]